jgi:hypothetical protein
MGRFLNGKPTDLPLNDQKLLGQVNKQLSLTLASLKGGYQMPFPYQYE